MEVKRPFAANGFLYNPASKEVLLHLRDGNTQWSPHKWSFFGGRAEGDEEPVECFVREIGEELMVTIDPKDAVFLRQHDDENDENWRQYSFYIESDMPKSAMTLTEGADFDWIPIKKIFDYDLADEVRTSLELFVSKIR